MLHSWQFPNIWRFTLQQKSGKGSVVLRAWSLNISLWKLFGWFRRPQLWATGDWQLHHDNKSLMHHTSCRGFWQNIKSPRWLSPTTAQIWCPATSGLSENWSHLWKGRDIRRSIRFTKIWWSSWWQLGELCEVPRCLLWRGLTYHCPMYNVSCIFFNKCL